VSRLLTRVVRWGLPLALLAATLVAASGLGTLLLQKPVQPAATPAVALNLRSPSALPAADDGTGLVPQDVPVAPCPVPRPGCATSASPPAPGCCR
jgi:hypothetical protein